jgi:hypothetical protein
MLSLLLLSHLVEGHRRFDNLVASGSRFGNASLISVPEPQARQSEKQDDPSDGNEPTFPSESVAGIEFVRGGSSARSCILERTKSFTHIRHISFLAIPRLEDGAKIMQNH